MQEVNTIYLEGYQGLNAKLKQAYLGLRIWYLLATKEVLKPAFQKSKGKSEYFTRKELLSVSKRIEFLILLYKAKIEKSARFTELEGQYKKVSRW